MNLPEDLAVAKEDLTEVAKQAAEETTAVNTVSHGVTHLKSRLILATTAWNNVFGYRNNVGILTTLYVESVWKNIEERVTKDVNDDAAGMFEVMWRPTQHLVNELYSNQTSGTNKTFAAILTSGDYVYINVVNNNFMLINAETETSIPGSKIVMVRETGVKVPDVQTVDLDDSKFVRTLPPAKGVGKPRHTVKELSDARHDRANLNKRRKANKAAGKQRAKNRK